MRIKTPKWTQPPVPLGFHRLEPVPGFCSPEAFRRAEHIQWYWDVQLLLHSGIEQAASFNGHLTRIFEQVPKDLFGAVHSVLRRVFIASPRRVQQIYNEARRASGQGPMFNGRVLGFYHTKGRDVYIDPTEDGIHTFAHEVGHALAHAVWPGKPRKHVGQMADSNWDQVPPVSEHAASQDHIIKFLAENFAEAFAHYVLNKKMNERAFSFIKAVLGSKKERRNRIARWGHLSEEGWFHRQDGGPRLTLEPTKPQTKYKNRFELIELD